jgi:RNA recognition motif-containing protein
MGSSAQSHSVPDREYRERSMSPGANPEPARNSGSNLFVTGLAPKVTEDDLHELFKQYGKVLK